jgi:hypothetical protein
MMIIVADKVLSGARSYQELTPPSSPCPYIWSLSSEHAASQSETRHHHGTLFIPRSTYTPIYLLKPSRFS